MVTFSFITSLFDVRLHTAPFVNREATPIIRYLINYTVPNRDKKSWLKSTVRVSSSCYVFMRLGKGTVKFDFEISVLFESHLIRYLLLSHGLRGVSVKVKGV